MLSIGNGELTPLAHATQHVTAGALATIAWVSTLAAGQHAHLHNFGTPTASRRMQSPSRLSFNLTNACRRLVSVGAPPRPRRLFMATPRSSPRLPWLLLLLSLLSPDFQRLRQRRAHVAHSGFGAFAWKDVYGEAEKALNLRRHALPSTPPLAGEIFLECPEGFELLEGSCIKVETEKPEVGVPSPAVFNWKLWSLKLQPLFYSYLILVASVIEV